MTYNQHCLPYWMKTKKDDPFDYKLRSKEEVYYQLYLNPPIFNISVFRESSVYDKGYKPEFDNNRYNKVKLYVKMTDLKLFPLQAQRLKFLLGRRLKPNSGFMKIVVDNADEVDKNIAIGIDTIKQLYFEALRAPLFIEDYMTEEEIKQRNDAYGNTREESEKNLKIFTDKTSSEYKSFLEFYKIVGNPNVKHEVKLAEWIKLIKSMIIDDVNEKETQSTSEEKKIKKKDVLKEPITRKSAYNNLKNDGLITEKAYKLFFENSNSSTMI